MRTTNAFALYCLLLSAAALAQSPTVTRLPIPDPHALARADELIHTLFKDDFNKSAPADRQAFARRLLTEAGNTKDDPAARYQLLIDSTELASSASDLPTAMQAAAALSDLYAIDTLDLKRQTILHAAAASSTPESHQSVGTFAITLAEQAAFIDNFELAIDMATLAESSALHTKNVAFSAALQPRIADIRDLAAEFRLVKSALEHLATSPNDADAHLTVGKFYALHKGQFALGLPHLALGSDPELRDLATSDLADPTDGPKQAALGDAWWDYSQKSTGPAKLRTAQHARDWYQSAKSTLTGITLARIQSRINTTEPAPAITPPIATSLATTTHLLPYIDPAKDAATGKWSLDPNHELTVASSKYAALTIPYSMPDEYDLRINFTRTQGEGPLCILLASGKKTFGFELDVKGEARFERVQNKIDKGNPTSVPATLSNNHPYTLTLLIRKDRIAAALDDKPLIEYKTDYKDLSRYALWKLPDEKLPGLGANNASITFHAIDLLEITGTGKPLR